MANYAAVCAIAVIGTEEAYKIIDRKKMYDFLLSVKLKDGSFMAQADGEVDVRCCYCALAVAKLLNLLTPELKANVAEYVNSLCAYDGGVGGGCGGEGHGGYTYCGVGALALCGHRDHAHAHAVAEYACRRQMAVEGGFQGRTNKLVDTCYSYWQGALLPVLAEMGADVYGVACYLPDGGLPTDGVAVQRYELCCCQSPHGGIADKPGKRPDAYHTCYGLLGLSLAQNTHKYGKGEVVGGEENRLKPCNPLFGISREKASKMLEYFNALEFPK